jgi:hypothetical protein
MIFAAQGAEPRLPGAIGCRFGFGLEVRRLLHHQKPPAPSNATRITPTIPTLIAQRIASFAIRKKMTSKTTPPIIKVVVEVMDQPYEQGYSMILDRQLSGS